MSSSFAHQILMNSVLPRLDVGMLDPIHIGFLAPLSGPVASWGCPGLNGCRIWVDWLNQAGGVLVGGRRYPVKLVPYDCQYDPKKAQKGARELIQNYNIPLLMMLGGDTFSPIREYLMKRKILTSTLLPSDLSPNTPYLIAPSENHPLYNVTGVEWLKKNRPKLRTVAICAQEDALGLPSLATYKAAFKAADIQCIKEVRYRLELEDPITIMDELLSAGTPDILCWGTSYTPMVHSLCEYAYTIGFKGQILSCTLDNYQQLVQKTSKEFLEGTVFQFPDFDDPLLRHKALFFNRPHQFFEEYNQRYPKTWSAVSWEYAAILEIWHTAVKIADTTNSVSVLAAMQQLGEVTHAFGKAQWWGEEIFGISNALVGDWPIVTLQSGKAKIVDFISITNWLDKHGDLLKQEMKNLGQLWTQRQKKDAEINNVLGQ